MDNLIKAGRTLIGMSQQELCEAACVPLITLRRVEGRKSHKGLVSDNTVGSIVAALEKAGVQFLDDGDISKGKGVALTKSPR